MLPGFAGIAGAGGQKLLSYQSFTADTANLTTYTFSSVAIGTASADRVVIVAMTAFTDSGQAISTVTIGGITATINVQAVGGGSNPIRIGIAAAVVPTGTTANVVVTMASSGISCMGLGVWTATGLPSATAIGTNSNTTLAGLAVTSEAGGFVIAVVGNGDSRTMTWTNATEQYDQAVESITFASGASDQTTGSSITVTATASGATTTAVIAAATF